MTTKIPYNDVPLDELAGSAEEVIKNGGLIFFKWTCLGCGERVTATTPNKFSKYSKHDNCGHITHTAKTGGNYLVMKSSTPEGNDAISRLAHEQIFGEDSEAN
jgi:hypothetical protein